MRLNVARTLPRSAANGPGERFVVWVQGCDLACPGCWNPDTWSFARRQMWEVDELVAAILETEGIEGVTFTGGEPFSQARALAEVARNVNDAGLSVFIFTGHELDELVQGDQLRLLGLADVVVAGRYVETERAAGLPWRGSSNQRVHFISGRYEPVQMEEAPIAEFHLALDGTMTVTGFPVEATLLDSGGQGSSGQVLLH